MRRKVLQGIVNNFCQMFVGWKLYLDMENVLLPLSQGKKIALEIDILTGQCLADGKVLDSLTIPEEMRSWFAGRLQKYNIPASAIQAASLHVEYTAIPQIIKIDRRPTSAYEWFQWFQQFLGRKLTWHYIEADTDFLCRGLIQTSDHEYHSINGKRADQSAPPTG